MIILGIADNHDAGAAVVIDGRLVSAVNQERVDRVKHSGAFPWGAIDEALRLAEVRERDVDRIVVGTAFTPSAALRAMPDQHMRARSVGQFSPWLHRYIVYQSALKGSGLHTVEVDACKRILTRKLAARPFVKASVEMMDHHQAHAEGAYRTQGHSRSLVLTVDAMGDGTTTTASMGADGQLDRLWRQSGLASINTFYSRVTERLGFTALRHEGKVTGLAAYAEPPADLVAHMAQRVCFDAPGFSSLSSRTPARADDSFWRALDRYSREEVASAAQLVLEQAVVPFVAYWVKKAGCGHVAVAGGVFANVKLNQRIASLDCVQSLWVKPHMGDGGLSVGAALGSAGASPVRFEHAYLGTVAEPIDIRRALSVAGFSKRTTPSVVERVASTLADGKVVARCAGAMEWGPRALGNRSILAAPFDPEINQWLNDRLKRSEFMPFAPVVRAEDVERWFTGVGKAPESARFMTVCFDVTPEFQEVAPAAVHVDGTARPQVVSAETNPGLHAVLTAFGEKTGVPVLINTSFNMHEEPMVRTPTDAIRAWKASGIEALWLGDHLLKQ
jgi:carbamoyltransferase